mmetsp:Transcript_5124/g.14633  ORF Transcript_5124/g.14633 Transcript_5124/m.14633 type:complete len:321 (-) Transcript_5124:1317-2279(-)
MGDLLAAVHRFVPQEYADHLRGDHLAHFLHLHATGLLRLVQANSRRAVFAHPGVGASQQQAGGACGRSFLSLDSLDSSILCDLPAALAWHCDICEWIQAIRLRARGPRRICDVLDLHDPGPGVVGALGVGLHSVPALEHRLSRRTYRHSRPAGDRFCCFVNVSWNGVDDHSLCWDVAGKRGRGEAHRDIFAQRRADLHPAGLHEHLQRNHVLGREDREASGVVENQHLAVAAAHAEVFVVLGVEAPRRCDAPLLGARRPRAQREPPAPRPRASPRAARLRRGAVAPGSLRRRASRGGILRPTLGGDGACLLPQHLAGRGR